MTKPQTYELSRARIEAEDRKRDQDEFWRACFVAGISHRFNLTDGKPDVTEQADQADAALAEAVKRNRV
jgi:hypothetical protein